MAFLLDFLVFDAMIVSCQIVGHRSNVCVVVKGTLLLTTSARPALVLTQLFLEEVAETLF